MRIIRNFLLFAVRAFDALFRVPPQPREIQHAAHPFVRRGWGRVLFGGGSHSAFAFALPRYAIPALALALFALGNSLAFAMVPIDAGVSVASVNLLFNSTSIPYSASQRDLDLLRAVNHHEIRLRLTGTIDVAGGTTNGTLRSDPVSRLIDEIRIQRDNDQIVQPITGRDLLYLTRRAVNQVVTPTEPSSAGVQTTAFRADYVIPFSPLFLMNKVDLAVLPRSVRQQFKLFVRFNTSRTTAGSDQGTGAFITGGDRTVTFTVTPSLQVTEAYSVGSLFGPNGGPWGEPRIFSEVTDQFTAANSQLTFDIAGIRRVGMLIMAREGAEEAAADLINDITLRAQQLNMIPEVPFDDLKTLERNLFPGVPSTEVGAYFHLFVDGGKLSNVLNPGRLEQPRWIFDVDAPGTSPGVIRIVSYGVAGIPGVTRFD